MAAHPAFPRQASRPGLDRPVLGCSFVLVLKAVRPIRQGTGTVPSRRPHPATNREIHGFLKKSRTRRKFFLVLYPSHPLTQNSAIPNQQPRIRMSNTETPAPIRPRLINEKDAARYIGMSESFLRKGRMEGKRQGKTPPPPYLRLGRSIKYRLEDLDQWLEARKVSR